MKISPDLVSNAAPTGKLLYGAYALDFASVLFFISNSFTLADKLFPTGGSIMRSVSRSCITMFENIDTVYKRIETGITSLA